MSDASGLIKCFLKSPPERGLANKELIALFADALRIPKADVEIISGDMSRKKRLKIHGTFTKDQVCAALGLDVQASLL